ncbi:MAG: hypothetical protein AAF889_08010 [Cyanobacteria bacterium P01_D01_bin.73]
MSDLNARLQGLGCQSEMRRLSQLGDRPTEQHTFTYAGRRNGRHWVRRDDGRRLTGTLATNGAIAIGARVRFANGQIDAMPFQPRKPVIPTPQSTPKFVGDVAVIAIVPDPPAT